MEIMKENDNRFRDLNRTISRAFQNYTPPEDLTVSEWAGKHRILSRENSAEAGPWNNDRTPYLVEVMDAFTDYRIEKITLVASSQVGKSELELNIIGYIIDQDPGSVLYVQPTEGDAKKFSRLRIAPMIRDSNQLRKKVSDVKNRDSGNTILQKSFPGGMLTIVGSNSASGLASTPARYVLGDERDRWALSAGTEGDPWALAEARTTTFYNSKMVDVSTPTIKGASQIEKSFNAGTRERWCNQCPECGDWHNIVFKNINFDFDTIVVGKKKDYVINSIEWCCPSCGCLSSEEAMRRQPAKWIAENPNAIDKGHRSFWLNAFASPWQPWHKVVYAFLAAKDDPARLKVVYNTMLGELWEDRGEIADEDTMLARREDYGHRSDGSPIELPEGVLVLTCGVDTQNDRLEYEVVGHGHFGETWGIKKGIIMGDPHESDVWERLDEVVNHVYKFENPSRGLTISQTFVDSGGHKTQDVYRECRERMNKRVFAIKGVGGDGVPYTRPPGKAKIVVNGRVIGQTWLYSIGVDAGKSDIMNNIKVQEPGAKYCHFPLGENQGYDGTFFNGLLSEKLVQRTVKGRTRWAWEKLAGHERNEALDCRNYALAAFRSLDPDLEAVERRLRGLTEQQQQRQPPKKKRQKVKKNTAVNSEW
ncbi:phage terminase large subunit family protein [Paenibacillus alvei]|uniref:Phage terminase large subunit family protein n=1 Tax=Paenibacillus alvei TaxID=44250 RepID=A0ABT4GZR8_PAEAL|nr:phage terminase large subunit family protein [Paenibacillus alvei]MCY9541842.1 phage terminase large subunit family protein [Paenibacillus alvei]MCY9706322.1 phage terminase large subunit family protein [Paenibacillus alvei]MCY9732242.1 phage terminase large subunit family protein [Paenibacillus alvei]MCY9756026.1 phage terminase large subunit family protein [Paenibacillus alvei]MCY9762211.1 phage terminase large subunit family protein [Paenibacillus alvei]